MTLLILFAINQRLQANSEISTYILQYSVRAYMPPSHR